MYKITVNESAGFQVQRKGEQLLLNDRIADWSCEFLPDHSFSILYGTKSFRAELLELDQIAKSLILKVEGEIYTVQIAEPLDELLSAMGLHERADHKANQIKAPMPGLVLNVLVTEGQQVKKGDAVLILEAMKMENVFKSPEDATVKEIRVSVNAAVEKGQVLMVLG